MARGGFRHLVVLHDGEVQGIISMRDIMAVWRPSARGAPAQP
jgi:signal-transduction protein with cAMP-binding, CBS, and nucleotidyltransferase domain